MRIVTPQQNKILTFIGRYLRHNGYAPSYREIAEALKLSSTATIHQHIVALKRKGLLTSQPGEIRSLQLINEPTFGQAVELPLLGLIAAGQPIEAIEDRQETLAVPAEIAPSGQSYVLRVMGSSMIEDGILDGDYVIVERNFYPNNGDVVVALINNSAATLKKYYRERDRIRLQPANSSMSPIFVKNPAIQGVVRAIIRKF